IHLCTPLPSTIGLFYLTIRRQPTSTLFPYTTLFRSGTVKIAGHDVVREASAVRREVGIIFQNPSLDMNLNGEENIRFQPRAARRDRKSARLNSSHVASSYAVLCSKKVIYSGDRSPAP